MPAIIVIFLEMIDSLLTMYQWVVIVTVIISLLLSFDIINTSNRFVSIIIYYTAILTEPVLYKIRRILPPIGGLDFSPLALLFLIHFTRRIIYVIATGQSLF